MKKNRELDFFGARLRLYRKNKGLSGVNFAGLIGISQGNLSDIETGKVKPSFDAIRKIIENTNIDIIWLITGQETPKTKHEPQNAKQAEFLAELETWAREISKDGSLDWLEEQLATCLPTWQMWRERKKAGATPADTDQVA